MTAEEEAKSAQATPKETTAEEPTDSDVSRGRTKAREAPRASPTTTYRTGTGESSTLRGRTRWRSTSPLVSRNTSAQGVKTPARGSSPKTRRLIRIAMMNRRRSRSPSRSTDRYSKKGSTRRRRRTRSRTRSRARMGEVSRHQTSTQKMEE